MRTVAEHLTKKCYGNTEKEVVLLIKVINHDYWGLDLFLSGEVVRHGGLLYLKEETMELPDQLTKG